MKKFSKLFSVLLVVFALLAGCNDTSEPKYKVDIKNKIVALNSGLANDDKLVKYFTDFINNEYVEIPFQPTKEEHISKYKTDLATYKEKIGVDNVSELKIKLTIKEISDLNNINKEYVYTYVYVIWEYALQGETVKQLVVVECSVNYNQDNDSITASLAKSYQDFLPNYHTYIK